jgi:hypothetical protein
MGSLALIELGGVLPLLSPARGSYGHRSALISGYHQRLKK